MSPVAGSIATTAPWLLPSAVRAASWRFGSIVTKMFAPRFGRPRKRSVNVEIASSGASPDR